MAIAERVGQIGGLPRGRVHSVQIDAYLDDRIDGEGTFAALVNSQPVASFLGPTLVDTSEHFWDMEVYMYNEKIPCAMQRATYWQTAKMLVA